MATNLYVNKVIFGGDTKIDLSDTTAQVADVVAGKDFYAANGEKVTGTIADGDLLSYGVRDLVGTATIGSSAICFEDSDPVAGTAVVGTAAI